MCCNLNVTDFIRENVLHYKCNTFLAIILIHLPYGFMGTPSIFISDFFFTMVNLTNIASARVSPPLFRVRKNRIVLKASLPHNIFCNILKCAYWRGGGGRGKVLRLVVLKVVKVYQIKSNTFISANFTVLNSDRIYLMDNSSLRQKSQDRTPL